MNSWKGNDMSLLHINFVVLYIIFSLFLQAKVHEYGQVRLKYLVDLMLNNYRI